MENQLQPQRIWQVSELNHAARALLETKFGLLTVCGEISGFTQAHSGHWYFTLKDMDGQIRCAMFRNRNLYCDYPPKEGDLVHLQAKVSIYPDRGEYQLIGEHLRPAGSGQLQQAFLQLKQKLAAAGLFDEDRKRPLPAHCRRIVVISSIDGAAIHDIISVAGKRMPSLAIDILPVPVQGPDAAAAACQAIDLCNILGMHDAIIIGRGGGSLEDLWSFNDESLAHHIANSVIPIISAVGHATDFTISDFVADVRATTPSAAAEIVTQDQQHLANQIDQLRQRLIKVMQNAFSIHKMQVRQLQMQLINPAQRLQDYNQRLDKLFMRLTQGQNRHYQGLNKRITILQTRLQHQSPQTSIRLLQQKLGFRRDYSY